MVSEWWRAGKPENDFWEGQIVAHGKAVDQARAALDAALKEAKP